MTDKQIIIIDDKIKPITLEDVPTILELHKSKSFVEIAKMYGVTQNAIRYWVKKYNVKPLKQKDQIKILEEQLKRAEKTMQEIWDRLGETSDKLLLKEQECKNNKTAYQIELDIYNQECLNLQEELKETLEQLDQLKSENEGFKILHKSDKGLITSTGKMNYQLIQEYDKLKTENERLKETFDSLFKVQYKLADNNKNLRQCLTEIKEIAEFYNNSNMDNICYQDGIYEILQKISECEGNDE